LNRSSPIDDKAAVQQFAARRLFLQDGYSFICFARCVFKKATTCFLTSAFLALIFALSNTKNDENMEVKDILRNLREKNNLTQEQMAERLNVTRQAVSRWETGETQPNPEMLKVLSRKFDVSINTLLGSPRTLICQCCGMPLTEDSMISRDTDGNFDEDYCKWCYTDGKFTYQSKEQLIDFCVEHLATDAWPKEQIRAHMEAVVPTLKHWR
jgi:transcriptional regulator with XRE-family HTH domain